MDALEAGRQYEATLEAARRLRHEAADALSMARELEEAAAEGACARAQVEIAVLEAAA
jgi:hypothetical protein